MSMFKTDGIFGGEVADLADDEIDPLGAVRKDEKKEENKNE